MNGREDKKQPARSERGRIAAQDREARQANALRENLKRRKAQRRGREEEGAGATSGATGKPTSWRWPCSLQ